MWRNKFFIFINILMVALQVTIIFIGSRVFDIKAGGISGTQWAICIVIASMSLPWGIAVRCFPDDWFAATAKFVGKPFVAVYGFAKSTGSKIASLFKKNKRSQPQDDSSNSAAAV
jgi:P-type Ca2+ transporter type 2C